MSSVVWFFDFPKNHRFQVFQEIRIKELAGSGYFLRIRIKVPVSSGYFKTLKDPTVFKKKPKVLSRIFPGSLIFELFFRVSSGGRKHKNIIWWLDSGGAYQNNNIGWFGSRGKGLRKWEPPVI
jgi:hypothetical protein